MNTTTQKEIEYRDMESRFIDDMYDITQSLNNIETNAANQKKSLVMQTENLKERTK